MERRRAELCPLTGLPEHVLHSADGIPRLVHKCSGVARSGQGWSGVSSTVKFAEVIL